MNGNGKQNNHHHHEHDVNGGAAEASSSLQPQQQQHHRKENGVKSCDINLLVVHKGAWISHFAVVCVLHAQVPSTSDGNRLHSFVWVDRC